MIVWLCSVGWAAPPPPPALPEDEQEVDVRRGGERTKDAEDWGFDTSMGPGLDIDDDDPEMADFVAMKRRKPPAPVHAHYEAADLPPLSTPWDVYVSAVNDQLVVLELPVLVAGSRTAFVAKFPHGVQLVGEYTSGGHTITVRQEILPADVLTDGPTFAFLKAALPNPKPVDQVRVVVKTAPLADPADSEAPTPALQERLARTTVYSR